MPTFIDINKFRPHEPKKSHSSPPPAQKVKGTLILENRAKNNRGTPENPTGVPSNSIKIDADIESIKSYLESIWTVFGTGGTLPKEAERYVLEYWDSLIGEDSRMTELVKLINKEKIQSVAEVGIFSGHLTRHLLDNCKTINNYYAIDHVKFPKSWKRLHKKYAGKLQLIHDTSESSVNNFDDNSLDLVFIDAGHLYHQAKQDIELWLPKIKQGGFLTGHDVDDDEVKRAVRDTIGEYTVIPPRTFLYQKI